MNNIALISTRNKQDQNQVFASSEATIPAQRITFSIKKNIKVSPGASRRLIEQLHEVNSNKHKILYLQSSSEADKFFTKVVPKKIRGRRATRFEFPGGIDNPETNIDGTSPEAEVFQTSVGGRCILPFRESIDEGGSYHSNFVPNFDDHLLQFTTRSMHYNSEMRYKLNK